MSSLSCQYVIDTNVIIGFVLNYPRHVFLGLNEQFENLVSVRRVVSHFEVKRELEQGPPDALTWATGVGIPFINTDSDAGTIQRVQALVRRYPIAAMQKQPRAPHADLWLIGYAQQKNSEIVIPGLGNQCVVLTNEKPAGAGSTKIPDICAEVGVDCVDLFELCRREGWRF